MPRKLMSRKYSIVVMGWIIRIARWIDNIDYIAVCARLLACHWCQFTFAKRGCMNTGSWIEVAIYWDVISRYCPISGRNTQLTIWHYTSDAIICFSLQWSMFAISICGAPIPGKVYVIAQNFVSCHVLSYPYLACHVMSCQIIYHTIYWCLSMAIVTQYSNRVHGWKTSTTCHCLTLVQLVRLLSSLSDCGFVLKSRGLSYFLKQSYKKISIHLCRLSSFA